MSLAFGYRGTEFPTQKMVDWFDYSFNQEPDGMNDLERDEWGTKLQNSFLEDFQDDMSELSYMEMLDVFEKARDKSLY